MSGENEPRIDDEVSAEERTTVLRGLRAFNEAMIGPANDRPVELVVRDTVMYSILATEWPDVKKHLTTRVTRLAR